MKVTIILIGVASLGTADRRVELELPPSIKRPRDAVDEVYNLSNNPERGDEWSALADRGRSVSVGDVVVVHDGGRRTVYLCQPFGWSDITQRESEAIEAISKADWGARHEVVLRYA